MSRKHPLDRSVDRPVDRPLDRPIDRPVDRPADRPVDRPVDRNTTLTRLRLRDLTGDGETPFDLRPDAGVCRALADELEILALKKLRFSGVLAPAGARDWELTATLGATAVQACVVTLAPVTTRIDAPVLRRYVASYVEPDADDPTTEMEMHDDVSLEPLPDHIDLIALMTEALALNLPDYPRAEGASLAETTFASPGVAPMTDDDVRPFAGLAALRETLEASEDEAEISATGGSEEDGGNGRNKG